MKNLIYLIVALLLLWSIPSGSLAQGTGLFEGFISYAIESADSHKKQEQLPQAHMDVWVGSGSIKVSLELAHSLLSTITNLETDEGFFFLEPKPKAQLQAADALGGRSTKSQLNKASGLVVSADKSTKQARRKHHRVVYTQEWKEILGYSCQKAIIYTAEGQPFYAYVAKDIRMPKHACQHIDFQLVGIDGLPLEYESTDGQGARLHIRATRVEAGPISSEVFALPNHCKAVSAEQLPEVAQGMYQQ